MSSILAFALISTLCLLSHPVADAFTLPTPKTQDQQHAKSLRGTTLIRAAGDDTSDSKERKPWDILRFISQSSKFVSPPSIPLFGGASGDKRRIEPGETLWAPSSAQNFCSFAPLDDVVMGGASSSTIDNNTGIWKGKVTDANNGGFVGIRSTPFQNGMSLDMSDCKGVEVKVRMGNGKRFKFVLRDTTEFNGICWTTAFDAGPPGSGGAFMDSKDEKSTIICMPFANQVPTIFANTVSGKMFDAENVVGLQLAYSKFEFDGKLNPNFELGDFSLQILEIKSY